MGFGRERLRGGFSKVVGSIVGLEETSVVGRDVFTLHKFTNYFNVFFGDVTTIITRDSL